MICPHCGSTNTQKRNIGRKIGAVLAQSPVASRVCLVVLRGQRLARRQVQSFPALERLLVG